MEMEEAEEEVFFVNTLKAEGPDCNGQREWRTASLPRRMEEV
jgi:hypothetical protein